MSATAIVAVILAGVALLLLISAIRIVREYERVVVFRLGRLRAEHGVCAETVSLLSASMRQDARYGGPAGSARYLDV